MPLKFLNKKCVHTGTFANIEKVWKREREVLEEIRKQKERDKKLKEEKQFEEIKKLKVEAGILPVSELDSVDFIYKDNSNLNNISDSLFKKKAEENKRKTFEHTQTANPICEQFTKTHEDPLYLIKKEELKRKKEVEENPQTLNLMLREIEQELLKEHSKVKIDKIKKNKDDKKNEMVKSLKPSLSNISTNYDEKQYGLFGGHKKESKEEVKSNLVKLKENALKELNKFKYKK